MDKQEINKEKYWKRITIILFFALILSLIFIYLYEPNMKGINEPIIRKEIPLTNNQEKLMTTILDDFASCLRNKGVKYYGSYTCPYCKLQDDMFGNSKKYLNYIECGDIHSLDPNEWAEVCKKNNIYTTPTWVFNNGDVLTGVQDLKTLANKSGCKLNL